MFVLRGFSTLSTKAALVRQPWKVNPQGLGFSARLILVRPPSAPQKLVQDWENFYLLLLAGCFALSAFTPHQTEMVAAILSAGIMPITFSIN